MSDSPRLAEATELAGAWIVTGYKKPCAIRLLVTRVDSANAWALTGGACLPPGLDAAVGWRPEPDGIALAGADGLTLALFSDQGDGRWLWSRGDLRLMLRRG